MKEQRGTRLRIQESRERVSWEGVDWIHLAQYTVGWRAVVNTVMNHGVP
jgi:hypothetical protein